MEFPRGARFTPPKRLKARGAEPTAEHPFKPVRTSFHTVCLGVKHPSHRGAPWCNGATARRRLRVLRVTCNAGDVRCRPWSTTMRRQTAIQSAIVASSATRWVRWWRTKVKAHVLGLWGSPSARGNRACKRRKASSVTRHGRHRSSPALHVTRKTRNRRLAVAPWVFQ